MEVLYFDELESTQRYLIEKIRLNRDLTPIAVVAKNQINGIGSRDNSWEGGEGNLFFSFAIKLEDLPDDLLLESASIYFSFLMKEVLEEFKDDGGIWLKWPNDLYYFNNKIGGTITNKIGDTLICGMGINLVKNSNSYKALNLNIKMNILLNKYFNALNSSYSWNQVFNKYLIEFERSREFSANVQGEYKSLEDAVISKDGSLIINNQRIYSLR